MQPIQAHIYKELRAKMLDAFPDLADDEQALADTLEGESDFPDALAAILRSARLDEAMAEGIKGHLQAIGERQAWLRERAKKRKTIVLHYMQETNIKKLTPPDFTASIRQGTPGVQVINEDQIPEEYWRVKKEPNLAAIRDALKSGEDVEGCTLKNTSETLTIRK